MRYRPARKRTRSLWLPFSVGVVLTTACGGTNAPAPPQTAAASVTPELGGTVTLPDNSATLQVPAGAVGATTMITVSTTTMSAPAGTTALSPVLKFEPDGLVFTKPVHVTFNFKSGATSPSVYWSNAAGGYDALGGMVSGTTIAADVTHFSSGFVGEGSPCVEGASCGAGSTCGVGPSSGGGTSTGGGSNSGGTDLSADAGAPMTNPPTGSSGGTSNGSAGSSGGASSDTAGSTSTGVPRTSALASDGMCCSCGADGTYHCGACASGADAGVPVCAEGAACQAGSSCGSGGTSTGGAPSSGQTGTAPQTNTSAPMCCMCGTDGLFHCGATCGGVDTGPDAGQTGGAGNSGTTGGGAGTAGASGGPISGGGGGGGSGTQPPICQPGAACTAGGAPCADASPSGACIKCTCGADGTLVCQDCGTPPPSSDAGAPPPPSPTCAQGAACTPGAGCGNKSADGTCVQCSCGADGTLSCQDCSAPPPSSDAGASQPPSTCAQGAACTPGTGCGSKSPDGGCLQCMCGADGTLSCQDCSAPPPPSDAGAPPAQPPVCAPNLDCPTPGAGCGSKSPDGGCLQCVCGPNYLLACQSC